MSFFDEGDAPRTARAGRAPRRPPSRGRAQRDQQQLRTRRAIALVAVVVVFLLLVLGIKSCVNGAAKGALRDYNGSVSSIVRASETKVSGPLFVQLSGAAGRAQRARPDVQTAFNDLRVEADGELGRAERLSVPDALKGAHRDLLLVLELRRDGVARIAEQIQPAFGSNSGPAIATIAAQMGRFLASDVVYSQHVAPLIREKLAAKAIAVGGGGEEVAGSRFLPDLGWLDPSYVNARLTGGTAAGAKRGKPAPGSHGHALTSVAVGGTALTAGGATNRVTAGTSPAFTVKVLNQGQNAESDVPVKVSITGAGAPIEETKSIARSPAGGSSTIDIPLKSPPRAGAPVTVKVTVVPVPGEKTISNNTQTYTVLFG